MGAGQVGCRLAQMLESYGDEVSIVDGNADTLAMLDNFSGMRVSGVAIDTDILRQAGIESCDAVAAVTSDDNVNLMVAQIAQDIFHVPKVLCRVYDPKRKTIYAENFSISTICPTSIAVDGIISFLKHGNQPIPVMFGATTVNFKTVPVTGEMIGKSTEIVGVDDSFKLFGIIRGYKNQAFEFFEGKHSLLFEGDSLVLCEK